jgi:uncharacterized protein
VAEVQAQFASQGQAIFGVLHTPEATPAPGLIMCHGFTGDKSESHRLFVNAARDFAAHGLAVLRFDFRGSGDSAGEFRDMTIATEIDDAQAALDFLASRPEVDPSRLGVLGLSLGGCVAACLAGREPERVKALVLWAAVAHTKETFARVLPPFEGAEVLDLSGWGLGRAFLDDARRRRPLEEVARYPGEALIVHGGEDQTVPVSDAQDYQEVVGARSRVVIVGGADHTFSHFDWKGQAIAASRDFLMAKLAGEDGATEG